MADETIDQDGTPPEAPAATEKDPSDFTITLKYNKRTSAFKFDGPYQDPALCYGMLELGKDIVRAAMMENARRQAQQQRIVQPGRSLPPEFRRR